MMRSWMVAGSSAGGSARLFTRGRRYEPGPSGVNNGLTHLSTNLEATAEGLFRRYAYPGWLRQHSTLVGRIATLLAERCTAEVDVPTVGLAGYLHDIGRSPLLAGDAREHNELSALVLAAEGLGPCAEMARRHPVYGVLDPASTPRTLGERIVYYADRRGGMAVLPMEERISETAQRHPRYAEGIERSRPAARAIERELFELIVAMRPDDLAREVARRWQ